MKESRPSLTSQDFQVFVSITEADADDRQAPSRGDGAVSFRIKPDRRCVHSLMPATLERRQCFHRR